MLGGRGGSTITDAAVFRINKVKTTVLDFLGNVDIQTQKTIIDNNVESNNSIIQTICSELIHIEEQLGSIQNYSFLLIKKSVISIIDELINKGINNDSKSLGCYYVLACLTLVNPLAANALPWLYESVIY